MPDSHLQKGICLDLQWLIPLLLKGTPKSLGNSPWFLHMQFPLFPLSQCPNLKNKPAACLAYVMDPCPQPTGFIIVYIYSPDDYRVNKVLGPMIRPIYTSPLFVHDSSPVKGYPTLFHGIYLYLI